jgi:hypothetical protein
MMKRYHAADGRSTTLSLKKSFIAMDLGEAQDDSTMEFSSGDFVDPVSSSNND